MKYLIAFMLGVTPVVAQNLTQEQKVIAMTILGEARGEGEAGMYSVACVLAQRVKNSSPEFSYTQICKAKSQFSCWNKNDPNRAKLPDLLKTPEAAYAKRLAIHIDKLERSAVNFADHYCSISCNPYWSFKKVKRSDGVIVKVPLKPVMIRGRHKFYKLR